MGNKGYGRTLVVMLSVDWGVGAGRRSFQSRLVRKVGGGKILINLVTSCHENKEIKLFVLISLYD